MNEHTERLDRVLLLLLAGMVFFTGALFAADIWFKDDQALFTVLSGLVTGFAGSFFTRLKPKDTPPSLPISDKSSLDVKATLHQEGETETPEGTPEVSARLSEPCTLGFVQTVLQCIIIPLMIWLVHTAKKYGVKYMDGKFEIAATTSVTKVIANDIFCKNLAERVVAEINGKLLYAKHSEQGSFNERFRQDLARNEEAHRTLVKALEAQIASQAEMHKANLAEFAEIRREIRRRRSNGN